MLHPAIVIALVYANGVVAALLAGRAAFGRATGAGLGLVGLGAPYLMAPDYLLSRIFTAMAAGFVALRLIELVRLGPTFTPLHRAVRVVAYYDTRRAVRVARRLDLAVVAHQYGYAALGAGGLALAMLVAPELDGVAFWLVRWLGGAVLTYALLDSSAAGLRALSLLCGYEPPPLHDRPILARSVGELWSRRWNVTVSAYLRVHALWPLARRGHAFAGLAASFVLSGLLHGYLVFVALGWWPATWMFAFFSLQLLFTAIERWARIGSWRPVFAHAWTVALMAASSPLFCEPGLRAIDPLFAS